jgi:hypothetical protein
MKSLTRFWFLLTVVLGLAVVPQGASAQVQPDPLPAPNVPLLVAGSINAVARQADGGMIVVGSFNFVNGQARNNLARIKPDGTLDNAWAATFNNSVSTVAVSPFSGAVYVGGFFTAINGVTRNRIARFDASGNFDTGWDPSANSTVTALVADPLSDTIYAGGSFTTIGGQSHVGLGKIAGSGAGAVDATWTPALSSSSSVSSLVLADGSLYLGGTFKTVTSAGSSTAITRNRIARLSPTTGILDASWDPSANGQVSAIVVDSANGVVYLGGSFLTIGTSAVSRQRLARVSESGSGALDLTWNPAANSGVNALAFDSANSLLYVAGSFTTMTDSGGSTTVTRNRLGRVSTNSGLIDPAWTPAAGSSVAAVALSSDASTLLAGGSFATIGATTQLAFAALSVADGTLGISPEFANMGSAASIGHQSNGGIIVGGSFVKVGTAARTYLLRLNADGSLDANFNPVLSSSVSSIAIGADDSVYITGFFQTVNGIAESSIAKLDGATGATNTSWSCPLSDRRRRWSRAEARFISAARSRTFVAPRRIDSPSSTQPPARVTQRGCQTRARL